MWKKSTSSIGNTKANNFSAPCILAADYQLFKFKCSVRAAHQFQSDNYYQHVEITHSVYSW